MLKLNIGCCWRLLLSRRLYLFDLPVRVPWQGDVKEAQPPDDNGRDSKAL